MTRKTFYRKLREVSPQFNKRRATKEWVRLYKDGKCFCPITALAYTMTDGYYIPSSFYMEAANRIGLHDEDAIAIASAADCSEAELEGNELQTRRALTRAVELRS